MIREIITNIKLLRKPCGEATPEEAKEIIKDLEDTLATKPNGMGLSAPQIGVYKKVAIIRVGKDEKTGEYRTKENLINPKIVEKGNKILSWEGCLSFPGLTIQTDRYDYITVEMDGKKSIFVGLESIIANHEIDHLYGITIFEKKHKDINRRK